MQAHHIEKLANEGTVGQFQLRQQFIDDLFYKYKRETTLEEFYATLFTALPDGQAVGIVGTTPAAPLPRKTARAMCRTPASAKTQQFGRGTTPQQFGSDSPGPMPSPSAGPTGPAPVAPSPRTPPNNGGSAGSGAAAPASSGSASPVDPKGFGRVAPRTKPSSAPTSTLRMGVRGSARRGEEGGEE